MSDLLFLSRWFPYPPDNGSKLRVYHLLRALAAEHDVTLLSFTSRPGEIPATSPLHEVCRDVQAVPWIPFNPDSLHARLGFLRLTPRFIVDTFSPEMAHRIEATLAPNRYDAVIASQLDMAVYADCFRDHPALFEEAEVGVLYEQYAHATTWQRRLRYSLTWAKHRRYLARQLRHFVACTVVSERERQLLANAAPGYEDVAVIPNGINLADYTGVACEPAPNTLIFTGSFTYYVNHQAMVWFLREVYPQVQAAVPDVRLVITGDHANKPLPSAGDVTLTGFVEDVRPLLAGATISLAPLHEGGGTRLKILEAMALHTPVVATGKGAEGLAVQDGEHLLLADTPADFAAAIMRLLQDPALRQRLAGNAYQLVQARYNWDVIAPRFLNLVDHIIQN